MPHFPKPFFKRSRGRWYCQIGPKQHNLGADKKEAFERFRELMRSQPEKLDYSLALAVIDAFLEWSKQNNAPRSFDWYQRHLQVFARFIEPRLTVGQLKKHHLTACLAEHPTWSSTTKNGLCRAVCRAFAWAEEQELIARSPLARFKKPKAKRREIVLSQAEFDYLIALCQSGAFRDLLIAAWETGARPQELVRVEKRHVDLVLGRWVFPADESKGQQCPRVVYVTERAFEITRLLCLQRPAGPIFRNEHGTPWNQHSTACAFGRLQVAMGLQRMHELGVPIEPIKRFSKLEFEDEAAVGAARKTHLDAYKMRRRALLKTARKHGTKYALYHFRHSWATRAVQRGVDPLTVAILMGHKDPSMLARVYQHLAHDPDFLRVAAAKVNRSA
jgi:integrase